MPTDDAAARGEQLDVDNIQARSEAWEGRKLFLSRPETDMDDLNRLVRFDIPALCAEVKRLRALLAGASKMWVRHDGGHVHLECEHRHGKMIIATLPQTLRAQLDVAPGTCVPAYLVLNPEGK